MDWFYLLLTSNPVNEAAVVQHSFRSSCFTLEKTVSMTSSIKKKVVAV
jgi:hypothetical protein